MIYISSSCIKTEFIKDSVLELANYGFKNIELSGGTNFYNNYINDLLELKNQFGLTYLIHNYFPPPKDHFVLNLASLNDDIFKRTITHFKKSIEVAETLCVNKIGLHAGFLIDPSVSELGNPFKTRILNDRVKAIDRFCEGYNQILEFAGDIEVYIENNVCSEHNYNTYNANPFLFASFSEIEEFKNIGLFSILFDVGHLKVSCKTLKLNYIEEFNKFIKRSDYIHISDNEGYVDSNEPLKNNSELFELLSKSDLKNKIFTIEVCSGNERIIKSYQLLKSLIRFC